VTPPGLTDRVVPVTGSRSVVVAICPGAPATELRTMKWPIPPSAASACSSPYAVVLLLRGDGRQIGGEVCAEPPERAAGLAFHCAGRIAQRVRGFLLGKLVPEPQHNHRPLAVRQLLQGPDQPVPVRDRLVQRRGRGRDVDRRGQELPLPPAGPLPPVVAGGVDHGPAGVRQRVVQPGPAQVDPGQRVLDRVFGPAAVAAQQEREPDQRIAVGADELVEGRPGLPCHRHLRLAVLPLAITPPARQEVVSDTRRRRRAGSA